MKKTNFFRIALAIALAAVMILSLASCGSSNTSKANDVALTTIEGTSISWKYTKSTQTLEISGSGAMPDFESTDAVAWKSVVSSVKVVKVSDGITNVGNYAFYYMTQLETAELPASVTTIGKSAFAFCKVLPTVALPAETTAIGERAFEASGLTHITIPEKVATVGDSAFIYCAKLVNVVIKSTALQKIEGNTFMYCRALSELVVPTALLGEVSVAPDTKIAAKEIVEGQLDAIAPPVDNAPADTEAPSETVADSGSDNAETEAPADTEAPKEEGLGTKGIIAIVALAVVVIAVVVGVVLFIRFDKKNSGNTTTVRKNKDGKDNKGNKKNGKKK